MIKQLLWVALGGAMGSMGRFLVGFYITRFTSSTFPLSTLAVNLVGCFVIGMLGALSLKTDGISDYTKLFLMTGICGGFTTFSAFSLESVVLLRDEKIVTFLLYILTSVVGGLLATLLAFKLFKP